MSTNPHDLILDPEIIRISGVTFPSLRREQTFEAACSVFNLSKSELLTVDNIKKTYRKLTVLTHPDKNRHQPTDVRDKIALTFQKIQNAYEFFEDNFKFEQSEAIVNRALAAAMADRTTHHHIPRPSTASTTTTHSTPHYTSTNTPAYTYRPTEPLWYRRATRICEQGVHVASPTITAVVVAESPVKFTIQFANATEHNRAKHIILYNYNLIYDSLPASAEQGFFNKSPINDSELIHGKTRDEINLELCLTPNKFFVPATVNQNVMFTNIMQIWGINIAFPAPAPTPTPAPTFGQT